MSEENTPADLRKALDEADKAIQKATKRAEEAEQRARAAEAREAFRDAKLDPNLSLLYTKVNPEGDITVEAAAEFAKTWNIGVSEVEQPEDVVETEPKPAVKEPAGLDNLSRAGSKGGVGGQPPIDTKLMTTAEFVELQRRDPESARKALAEGRVKTRSDNPFGREPTAAFVPANFGGSGSEE